MKKEAILEFKGISKKFGKQTVLSNVSFSIYENEIFGLLGRSGAGKTTLLHILLGLVEEDKGVILYKGRKIRPNSFAMKKKIGFAAQDTSFYPKLSVEENLWYYGRMYDVKRKVLKERITRLLELFSLQRARKVSASKLSGGMKRRLDLAICLIHDPDIIILDEPTTGLDIILSDQIWDMIKRIKEVGKTVIISSHILHQMQQHCTTFGILDQGMFYDHKGLYSFAKKHKIKSLERLFVKFLQ